MEINTEDILKALNTVKETHPDKECIEAIEKYIKNQSEALKVAIEAMEISHFLNNKENIRQFLRDKYDWACPEDNENKVSIAVYISWALNETLQKIKELTGQ